jgi:glutamate-1-semialdehyde 2,1-aminomutase
MTATDSSPSLVLTQRANEIAAAERLIYETRTRRSQASTRRAAAVLPLGVPSSFQFYEPHPIVAARAQGAWLEDLDGNHYVDCNMGFGALLVGHGHPVLVEAL